MSKIPGRKTRQLILASSSPRRKELLEKIGLTFKVIPSKVDEKVIKGELPVEYVLRLAEEKVRDVVDRLSSAWVIGADTIVLLEKEILGKPFNSRQARQMLLKLSGKEHRVITGFSVFDTDSGKFTKDYVETIVIFKHLTDNEIRGYVKSGEPLDKAGGYAIQGAGCFMVKEIKGSYTNVVGLPICELVEVLSRLGGVDLFGMD